MMRKVFRTIAVTAAAALLLGAISYFTRTDVCRDFDWRLVII